MGYQEMTKEELALAICAAIHDIDRKQAREKIEAEPEGKTAQCFKKYRRESRETLEMYYKQLALHIIDGTARRVTIEEMEV